MQLNHNHIHTSTIITKEYIWYVHARGVHPQFTNESITFQLEVHKQPQQLQLLLLLLSVSNGVRNLALST